MDRRLIAFLALGLLLAVALGAFVSPHASSSPDGLEKVAQDKGFIDRTEQTEPAWQVAPIPDYGVQGVEDRALATGLAGVIGTLVTFAAALGLARGLVLVRRRRQRAGGSD